MCGIAGIVSEHPVDRADITRMTMALLHRGPDAQQVHVSESGLVALGHTRLSIIDLSASANQPMHSADGRYTVVFNGEIYNFQALRKELQLQRPGIVFKTQSDTEVLLHGYAVWGKELARKLEGMFAFVVNDAVSNELVIVRDRLGKKPIFYGVRQGVFVFASEIKSILVHPLWSSKLAVDQQALTQFLHLGYIPAPHTIYQDIAKFPAASIGILKRGVLETETYWKAERKFNEALQHLSDEGAKSLLRQSLEEAVAKRLIADVPLGSFLSGGTDSSLVTAIANRIAGGRLKTFNIGFEESAFDESEFAREAARQMGTDHTVHILKEHQASEMLESCIDQFDEPFADTSAIPTMLISQIAREQVTVALTGDGGDELFLGYGMYDWASRLESPLFRHFAGPAAWLLQHAGARARRAAHLFEPVARNEMRAHIFSQEQYFLSKKELNLVQRPGHGPFNFSYTDPALPITADEQQALFDLQFYLIDDLLVKVDRASMRYALECRSPLLDSQVVALAFSLPYRMKKRGGERKWILKELLCEHLSKEMVYRRKWGFSVPLAKWLRKDLSFLLDQYLSKQAIEQTNLFQFEVISQMVTRFRQGENYLYNRLWVLIVLQRWLLKHG
ncbi:MAG: asparagine synthase (glutamine-hydrolyzing) [Cyclobacteriaceae bacterium]|nr:asparagine synthase (glutamine-hydrolyzing) [Cyclobacteriaceae bacterium]